MSADVAERQKRERLTGPRAVLSEETQSQNRGHEWDAEISSLEHQNHISALLKANLGDASVTPHFS